MNRLVKVTYFGNSTIIQVNPEDDAVDVVLASLNALDRIGCYIPTLGLQILMGMRRWTWVDPKTKVRDMEWTDQGLMVWNTKYHHSRYAVNADTRVVRVTSGECSRDILVLPTYTIEKAFRIAGIDISNLCVFIDKDTIATPNTLVGDFNELTIGPVPRRVYARSPEEQLAYLDVLCNGTEHHLAVSPKYGIRDIPYMIGDAEPESKVCVVNKKPIFDDYASVALIAGERIELQSVDLYL